jgi:hypothetical protein
MEDYCYGKNGGKDSSPALSSLFCGDNCIKAILLVQTSEPFVRALVG